MSTQAEVTDQGGERLSTLDALELEEQNVAPEAAASQETSGTEGESTESAVTEGVVPENQEPFWPGKFNTPDDLRSGYENLERSHTQARQEAAELRQQIAQIQQMQAIAAGYQPQPGPAQGQPALGFDSAYQHPTQGYSREELEAMQYDDPIKLADYVANQKLDAFARRLSPILAEQQEWTRQQQSEALVANLRGELGAETFNGHEAAVMEVIQSDPSFFNVPPALQQQRVMTAFLAEMQKAALAAPPTDRPRAENGQFVKQEGVHVEAGSSGPTTTDPNQNVAPEIREMRESREQRDVFGVKAPVVTR